MKKNPKEPCYGEIVCIGITKDGRIMIEFFGYGLHDQPTDCLFLDGGDCKKITQLYEIMKNDKTIP